MFAHVVGQALVIFKTREAAKKVVRKLDEGCLLLSNGRYLDAFPCMKSLSFGPNIYCICSPCVLCCTLITSEIPLLKLHASVYDSMLCPVQSSFTMLAFCGQLFWCCSLWPIMSLMMVMDFDWQSTHTHNCWFHWPKLHPSNSCIICSNLYY